MNKFLSFTAFFGRLIFFVFFCQIVIFVSVYANIDERDPYEITVLPPSPTADDLGRYGTLPVGYFTGTPSVSIPLVNFSSQYLNLPISLSYNSNGIKVDQISSWIGMGWSLNAGGVITRQVMDEADEVFGRFEPEDITKYSQKTVDFINHAHNSVGTDTEPDIFSFNFNGYSGKFVLDSEGNPLIMPRQNMVFQFDFVTQQIAIIMPNGVKYYFGGVGAIEKTKTNQSGGSCSKSYEVPITTAWYLTKIEHPTGDKIELKYKPNNYTYTTGVIQTYTKLLNPGGCTTDDGFETVCEPIPSKLCVSQVDQNGVTLTEIFSEKYGRILFESEKDRGDVLDYRLKEIKWLNTANDVIKKFKLHQVFSDNQGMLNSLNSVDPAYRTRMFLEKVENYGSDQNQGVNQYSFEYDTMDDLPARLSFAQDHWGYYNGVDNINFYPTTTDYPDILAGINGADRELNSQYSQIGLLKKIIYPTGGYNEFQYEQNTYWGAVDIQSQLTNRTQTLSGQAYGSGGEVDNVYESTSFYCNYEQTITFELQAEFVDGGSSDAINADHATLKVTDETTGDIYTLTNDLTALQKTIDVTLQKGHSYWIELEVTTQFRRIDGSVYWTYQHRDAKVSSRFANVKVGGVRIRQIRSVASVGAPAEILQYHYASRNDLTKSSGKVPMGGKIYTSFFGNIIHCEANRYTCSYVSHSSKSTNSLYSANYPIAYSNVTVSHGENFAGGGEEFVYNLSFDTPAQQVWGTDEIYGASQNNTGWAIGELKEHLIFSRGENSATGFETVSTTKNFYKIDSRYDASVSGYVVRKNYEEQLSGSVEVVCTAEILAGPEVYEHEVCDMLIPRNCEVVYTSYNQCRIQNKSVGETVIYNYSAIDNFDVMQYTLSSKWWYLDSTVTISRGNVEQATKYIYGNPDHALLTNELNYLENDEVLEKSIYYPQDYVEGQFSSLIANNILSVPIEKRIERNGKLVAAHQTIYFGNGLPQEIRVAESELGTVRTVGSDNPYTYSNMVHAITYNDNLNVSSRVGSDGVSSVYLWGYGGRYPVAEIIGASINGSGLVEGFEGHMVSATLQSDIESVNADELTSQIENYFDALRAALPECLITTYTHKPLLGISSQTNPSGLTTYYEFDDFGRLKTVLNENNKVLKSFEYNYGNPSN